tara:strand:- start:88 stop:456 length:369 start_codon:yes stop_codon:yes gene_type:complete
MSCDDYIPERDNDYDEYESCDKVSESIQEKDILKLQDDFLKKLYDDGGIGVQNIIEIQYMMELIKYVPENYKQHQKSIAKCLELIINLANQYLELYSKSKLKVVKSKSTSCEDLDEDEDEDE